MLLINGSSRDDGNTDLISKALLSFRSDIELINLLDFQINDFSYDGLQEDDFTILIHKVLEHETTIWLTPIYWYTMSGIMKRFLDRFSDLLKWNKPLGRKLRGKNMAVISSSESDDAPAHFEEPFLLSADYLGMNYLGYCHTWIEHAQATPESISRLKNLFLNQK